MILDWIVSVTCGWALILAAGALAMRHILLNPTMESWPDAPGFLREFIFAKMGASALWGLDIIFSIHSGREVHVPLFGAIFAMVCAAYESGMAWNVLRQHYRKEVWRRLKRADRLARCSDGGALAFLFSLGWTVVAKRADARGLVDRD